MDYKLSPNYQAYSAEHSSRVANFKHVKRYRRCSCFHLKALFCKRTILLSPSKVLLSRQQSFILLICLMSVNCFAQSNIDDNKADDETMHMQLSPYRRLLERMHHHHHHHHHRHHHRQMHLKDATASTQDKQLAIQHNKNDEYNLQQVEAENTHQKQVPLYVSSNKLSNSDSNNVAASNLYTNKSPLEQTADNSLKLDVEINSSHFDDDDDHNDDDKYIQGKEHRSKSSKHYNYKQNNFVDQDNHKLEHRYEIVDQSSLINAKNQESYLDVSDNFIKPAYKNTQFTYSDKNRGQSSYQNQFIIKQAQIIKARASIDNGATFINQSFTTSLDSCFVECLIIESCDTIVFQNQPINIVDFKSISAKNRNKSTLPISPKRADALKENKLHSHFTQSLFNNHHFRRRHIQKTSDNDETSVRNVENLGTDSLYVCYLFECAKSDGFKCLFSSNAEFTLAVTKKYTQKFILHDVESKTQASTIINNDISLHQSGRQLLENVFSCFDSSSLLPINARCDGIMHCLDGSDEFGCAEPGNRLNHNEVPKTRLNLPIDWHKHLPQAIKDSQEKSIIEPAYDDEKYSLRDALHSDNSNLNTHFLKSPNNQHFTVHYSNIKSNYLHHNTDLLNNRYHHPTITISGVEDSFINSHSINPQAWTSFFIALAVGLVATSMLVLIVSHKLRSIRRKIVTHNNRTQRSLRLPLDTESLIASIQANN